MKYNLLGCTDIKVSAICLGTMTWGMQNTAGQAYEQMDYAIEQGVNFFDTAEMYAIPPTADTYGKTEKIIGSWFKERQNRDKIILATKVSGPGLPWVRGGNARLDRKNIRTALEGSLKRLQTDYVDLYQLHWPNRPHYHFGKHWDYTVADIDGDNEKHDFIDILQVCHDLMTEGKIRHIGLSNETCWGIMNYVHLSQDKDLPRVASIQNEYSLLCRIFEPDLSEVSIHEQVGLLAYSPLAAGALSGKYLNGAVPKGSRRSLLSSKVHRDTDMAQASIKAYMEVAKKHGLDVCQMALAFVSSKPFVTSNIIGATTMKQLQTNIDSIKITLSESVLQDIQTVFKKFPVPY